MANKRINELQVRTPQTTDLMLIGDPTTGYSFKTTILDALNLGVPTTRTLTINGTTFDLSANRTWNVGTVTSVGLTMPSAFTVTSSPVTGSGNITVVGAGNTTQYIAGDGSLVSFPIAGQAGTLVREVRNVSGATITKGTVVYINGANLNLPTIAKAIANSDATSAQTFGVVQNDIANNNNGYVVAYGDLIDLDTSAYSAGSQLYLSSTVLGGVTTTKPYAPNHLVYIGVVTRSHPSQGRIEVRIQNGYELEELHNVAALNPSDNDILQYKSSTGLWTKTAGTTTNIAEGTNLYFTNARARSAISITTFGTGGAAIYDPSTGILNIPNYSSALSGYVPYTGASNSLNLGTNNILAQNYFIDGNGTDGGYLAIKQFNSSNSGQTGYTSLYALQQNSLYIRYSQTNGTQKNVELSSALLGTIGRQYLFPDKNGTFAMTSDIPSLSGYVQGSGTTNFIAKFTASGTIGNSLIFDNGTNVGIGSTTATYKLTLRNDVAASTDLEPIALGLYNNFDGGSAIYFSNNVGGQSKISFGVDSTGAGTNDTYLGFSTGANTALSERMRITSAGNLLIGTTTDNGARLQVSGNVIVNTSTNNSNIITLGANSERQLEINNYASGGNNNIGTEFYKISSIGEFRFRNFSSTLMTITGGGNVGIGVTPSAWGVNPFFVQQIGTDGGFIAGRKDLGNQLQIGQNAYYDGTNWIYTINGSASRYILSGNEFRWLIAPSGTAGNAITFTQAMTLDASGRLLIGATSSVGVDKVRVNNDGAAAYSTVNITNANSAANMYVGVGGNSVANVPLRDNAYVWNAANTGLAFGTNDLARMFITSGGDVGIGNINPAHKLDVSLPSGSNGQIIRMNRSAGAYGWGIGIDGVNSNFNFYNNGGTSVSNINNSTGAYTATSDMRVKENIIDSNSAIDKIINLKVRQFNWKESGAIEQYGLIAQEVYEVLPSYVTVGDENTNWGVSRESIVPFLIKAIQELKAELDTLKNK